MFPVNHLAATMCYLLSQTVSMTVYKLVLSALEPIFTTATATPSLDTGVFLADLLVLLLTPCLPYDQRCGVFPAFYDQDKAQDPL